MDIAEIDAIGLMFEIAGVTYGDVLRTFETNPLEPDSLEYKYYAPGPGLFRIKEGLDRRGGTPGLVFDLDMAVVPLPARLPLFFNGGHWLSLYGTLWPQGALPPPELRTMASDLPDRTRLPNDVPNARKQSLGFFAKIFVVWAAIGFHNPKSPKRERSMPDVDEKIEIESATSPCRTEGVNRAKYMAMKEALLPVLPTEPPGMTVAEAKTGLLPHLSQGLFPGEEKAGWWFKTVQLDLEAKGAIARGGKGPVRLFRTGTKHKDQSSLHQHKRRRFHRAVRVVGEVHWSAMGPRTGALVP